MTAQTPRLAFYAPDATKAVLSILDGFAERCAAARFARAAQQMARLGQPAFDREDYPVCPLNPQTKAA